MSGARPLPGFFYDPQTNRYYRQQQAGQFTISQATLFQKNQELNKRAALDSLFSHVDRQKHFDKVEWKFSPIPSKRINFKRDSKYESVSQKLNTLVIGAVCKPTRRIDPVVVYASNEIYPSSIPGRGLMKANSPEIFYEVSWNGAETRVISRPVVSPPPPPPNHHHHHHHNTNLGDRVASTCIAYHHPKVVVATLFEDSHSLVYANLSPSQGAPANVQVVTASEDLAFSTASFCNNGIFLLASDGSGLLRGFWRNSIPDWQKLDYEHRNSIISTTFEADEPENYLLSTSGGKIYSYRRDSPHCTFLLSKKTACQRLFNDVERCALFAETFHGQLVMFDWRYPQKPSYAININQSSFPALDSIKVKYAVDSSAGLLYGAVTELGYILAWDMRRLTLPIETWNVDSTITSMFMAPVTTSHGDDDNPRRLCLAIPPTRQS